MFQNTPNLGASTRRNERHFMVEGFQNVVKMAFFSEQFPAAQNNLLNVFILIELYKKLRNT